MTDTGILAGVFRRLQQLYREEGGAFPEPILNLTWNYSDEAHPSAAELAQEYNGRALADVEDQGRLVRRKGELLNDFGELRADGSTSCGCWIYSGAWTEQGNMMDRRDNSDPYDIGVTLGWAWAWPLNRRILYNRASARPDGTPWDPARRLVWWNGERWVGADVSRRRPSRASSRSSSPKAARGISSPANGWAKGHSPSTTSRWSRPSTTTR
jgi:formate dehydrogenase major subunit